MIFLRREAFATYLVYPNVSLSVLIDCVSIREQLAPDERDFFFRGQIDCVVFDQHDGYRPKAFFELDSTWHDTDMQHRNDTRKDRILALAGQRLCRIRRRGMEAGRVEFVSLLKEISLGDLYSIVDYAYDPMWYRCLVRLCSLSRGTRLCYAVPHEGERPTLQPFGFTASQLRVFGLLSHWPVWLYCNSRSYQRSGPVSLNDRTMMTTRYESPTRFV